MGGGEDGLVLALAVELELERSIEKEVALMDEVVVPEEADIDVVGR